MRRRDKKSKNIIISLIVLISIGIGIAYAVLTEQLTINNTVSYDAMKWDVGFTSAKDGYAPVMDGYAEYIEKEFGSLEALGYSSREEFEADIAKQLIGENQTYTAPTATISADKKSINVNCDLQMTSKSQLCAVAVTINNASTFNIALSTDPVITYDENYINFVDAFWLSHDVYEFNSSLAAGQTLAPNESIEAIILLSTNELTEDTLPSTQQSVQATVELNFEEVDYSISELAVLIHEKDYYAFWTEIYKPYIKNITFESAINIPDNAITSWDMSTHKDGRIMSYIVANESDSSYYDLYIQSNEEIYANFDMDYWFYSFDNVDAINGLELLNTKFTTDMNHMFHGTGYNSTKFVISITINNPNITNYVNIFKNTAVQPGSQVTVNYTSETSDLVDKMIATKTEGSNVVKGVQVD